MPSVSQKLKALQKKREKVLVNAWQQVPLPVQSASVSLRNGDRGFPTADSSSACGRAGAGLALTGIMESSTAPASLTTCRCDAKTSFGSPRHALTRGSKPVPPPERCFKLFNTWRGLFTQPVHRRGRQALAQPAGRGVHNILT